MSHPYPRQHWQGTAVGNKDKIHYSMAVSQDQRQTDAELGLEIFRLGELP